MKKNEECAHCWKVVGAFVVNGEKNKASESNKYGVDNGKIYGKIKYDTKTIEKDKSYQ